jgi:hypothetical protein
MATDSFFSSGLAEVSSAFLSLLQASKTEAVTITVNKCFIFLNVLVKKMRDRK